MESRIRVLFLRGVLKAAIILCLLILTRQNSLAADAVNEPTLDQRNEQIIDPKLERRKIITPKIDTEDFEVGAFFGFMSVEDFGVNPVYGANLTYHITEDLFVEGRIGFTEVGETSAERLFGNLAGVTDDRNLSYYTVSVGYNVFPGEGFWDEKTAFTSSLYLVAGIGSTNFADDDRFTFSYGAGYKILPTDWFTIRADIRDHIFSIDLLAESKRTHNIEATLGVTFFF
ncbi:MAG: outer membrane beta-barrel domain-containing protein [Gammaproteobacteria bacterium]